MTPRALVTAIATTAFGFALIISSVAGSTTGAETSRSLSAMAGNAIHIQPYHALAADNDASSRLAAWNDPCEIAL
jgi:hypothetical protein